MIMANMSWRNLPPMSQAVDHPLRAKPTMMCVPTHCASDVPATPIALPTAPPGTGVLLSVERAEPADDLRGRMAARLDAREREIITLRFGLDDSEPLTLKEVGLRLGFTREWVRKIERRAIAKLRVDDEVPA
jgi:DNA-binding CsgD family transcriptional regulator